MECDFLKIGTCDICQRDGVDVHKMALEEEDEDCEMDGFVCDKCHRILIHVASQTCEWYLARRGLL